MHINSYFVATDTAHLSRYKYLQLIKDSKKGHMNDYSHKMISSVSRSQNKYSKYVESNIQCNYRGLSSFNVTKILYISYFSTHSIT